jgi:hypothetical protein
MDASRALIEGDEFPYDAADRWWCTHADVVGRPPKPSDFAHRAARGIIANLRDRRGVKNGFDRIDEDMRIDMVNDAAEIIREAIRQDATELDFFQDPGASILVLSCMSCPSMLKPRPSNIK